MSLLHPLIQDVRDVNDALRHDPTVSKVEAMGDVVTVTITAFSAAKILQLRALLRARSLNMKVDIVSATQRTASITAEPEDLVLRHGSDGEMDIKDMLGDLPDATDSETAGTSEMGTVGTAEMNVVEGDGSDVVS